MKNIFMHFRGNLLGGITAGIVALPLALAFGVQSGLGPDAGLYGAIFIGFFASLFGGTPLQISGPTAPMTAVSMLVVAAIISANNGNVAKALPFILLVFLLAGLLQVLLGILKLGKYIKYIPYPVVSGFMTAIGVIILITQLLPLLGYYVQDDREFINGFKPEAEEVLLEKILQEEVGEGILVLNNLRETALRAENITSAEITSEAQSLAKSASSGVLGAIKSLPRALDQIDFLELILAGLTIFIIFGFKKITTTIPSTLVALLTVSGGAYFLGLDYRPIQEIPAGFPMPHLEIFSEFEIAAIAPYIFMALTLALLGAIDSLLTSVVADNMTKTRHNSNKELIGQGIGNSIAALFGGLPGAGATIRTVVNINSGGKTRLSGMIAALVLLVVLLALGPVASQIPAAVLAGILITVGIGVMDYKGLKAIPYMPKAEIFIMVAVLLLATFWNLVYAVGIGLIIAALVFMKKMGEISAKRSEVIKLDAINKEESENLIIPVSEEEVYVKKLEGPLFFGYTNEFQLLVNQIPSTASYVIIRMERVSYIDQSGLFALEDVLLKLQSNNIKVFVTDLQQQPRYLMERMDIIPDLIATKNIFTNFRDATKFVETDGKGEVRD
ncbi:MAG: SulP family inorganic anion transporter [Gillisia sp.]